ncbi:MAG: bifunctional diguanylate cyclase/phosphodiesterase [Treponema sp.]
MENEKSFTAIDSKQIREIISFLEFCTDSFVFAYDIDTDAVLVSNETLTRFNLPSTRITNAMKQIVMFVREDERDTLIHNVGSISEGGKSAPLTIYHFIDKSGNIVPVRIREKIVHASESGGDRILIGSISFIEQPVFDEITGLESEKQAFLDYKSLSGRKEVLSGFLMEIDVDNFTSFSEREGGETGDEILKILAEACRLQCTDGTSVYLMAERKFLLMNLQQGSADIMRRIYSNLKREIQNAEYSSAYKYMFTISAGGIALYKEKSDLSEILKKLTFSLDTAKLSGKNNLYLFNAVEYNNHLYELELENMLRISTSQNFEGFRLFYQPVIDAGKMLAAAGETQGKYVVGAEALLRWENKNKELIGADYIVPILERSNFIIPVGRWVLMTACAQCSAWNKIFPDFHMSINISYIQMKKANFVDEVQAALEKTHVTPQNIILELTESGHIDSEQVQKMIVELAALGVQIDIDDFGTGYSNLRYIQNLHADTLKLDYTFVHKAVTGDGKDQKIIEYITKMAHDLGMTVCMEGIESHADIQRIGYIKPDKFQGFLFGRPVCAEQFEKENLYFDRNIRSIRGVGY